MATIMKKNDKNIINYKNAVSWEKTGNASWAQCPECDNWFNIGPSIISKPEIKFHCPNCHKEFFQEESKKIIIA